MKKFVVIGLSVILLFLGAITVFNVNKYNNYKKEIKDVEKTIKNIKKEYNTESNIKIYEDLKNKNKTKVEEFEKWQVELKKIKDLL